ncbi:hypothetical protein BT96DRAFT_992220 [Gymnopus androsaceus JB14]|uniref:Uncharacterized protein n=1 Tax=Gymnopus androsaceus JB14 TaxID=1447944 RepID=A0A6A4HVP2_9AGAR|nr:hypothetical protein BT96DRAFT_992220 [Gymnopus androsaceus JB14]
MSHGVVPEAGLPRQALPRTRRRQEEVSPDTIIHTVLSAPARNTQLSTTNIVPSVECLFTRNTWLPQSPFISDRIEVKPTKSLKLVVEKAGDLRRVLYVLGNSYWTKSL